MMITAGQHGTLDRDGDRIGITACCTIARCETGGKDASGDVGHGARVFER